MARAVKTKKKRTKNEITAWVANQAQAATFSTDDLELLQKRFSGKLTISRMRDGGTAIYPSVPGAECHEFNTFMDENTPFQKQRLDINSL